VVNGRPSRLPAVGAGIVADRLLGEPPARLHPVAGFGRMMAGVEARLYSDRRSAGTLHAIGGVTAGALSGLATRSTLVATYLAVAGRALGAAAVDVAEALDRDDLDGARGLLPSLVGRDPSALDLGEIVRSVVESVAENTVDAVVAPVFWAAVAAGPGALGYRAVNTLDAMVGHRSPRYERYGWASARLDDLASWVPARITAMTVGLVRPAAASEVLRAVRQDAPAHPSPNAGVAEAAFAAALGIRLGGINRYGDRLEERPPLGRGRAPERCDIGRAVRLSNDVGLALVGLLLSGGLLSDRLRGVDRQSARRWARR
jgi:adenosylcobinamide-phosphate synthase